MKRTLAVILAGGEGARLSILSEKRAKPAVPFGGKYRIIDFALINCVNSDIDNVVVLTQYNPRSLNDHIGHGRAVGPRPEHRRRPAPQPYIGRGKASELVPRARPTRSSRTCNVRRPGAGRHRRSSSPATTSTRWTTSRSSTFHRRKRADVTIAVRRVPLAEATRMGILAMDDDRAASPSSQEKPKQPK